MNHNTLLRRVELNPDCFKEIDSEPVKTNNGYIYDLQERTDQRICPFCNGSDVYIKEYYHTMINISDNQNIHERLRIKRVRFFCRNCSRSFTNKIEGIRKYDSISGFVKKQIMNDFFYPLSFQQIADKYHLSSAYVIRLFDENFKKVPVGSLPEILCIDEIHFSSDIDQKYVCVLVDYKTRTVYDIIQSRQMAYLDEYFARYSLKEREKVRFLISDMYDGYATIRRKYFPNAQHVIDLFHIVIQLNRTINMLRTRTMNRYCEKGSKEYNFMKAHWKYFLCRKKNIPDKFYTYKQTGECIHYDDMIFKCIQLNDDFWTGYKVLQDLFSYSRNATFTDASKFIEWIYKRLLLSTCDDLVKVGQTYYKWRVGIATALAKNQFNLNLSNGIAEGLNNQLKTLLKSAYGYQNFSRFRIRALLILKFAKLLK